jgi:hypothetical protein
VQIWVIAAQLWDGKRTQCCDTVVTLLVKCRYTVFTLLLHGSHEQTWVIVARLWDGKCKLGVTTV